MVLFPAVVYTDHGQAREKKEKINIFRSCKRGHLTLLMTIDGEEANKEFEGG
jgi:hypothetical protein